MITTPEENLILTPEEQKREETVKTRLLNLQNEVTIANRILSELRNDTERITKERNYQHSLLDELLPKVADAQGRHESLLTEITRSGNMVATNTKKAQEIMSVQPRPQQ